VFCCCDILYVNGPQLNLQSLFFSVRCSRPIFTVVTNVCLLCLECEHDDDIYGHSYDDHDYGMSPGTGRLLITCFATGTGIEQTFVAATEMSVSVIIDPTPHAMRTPRSMLSRVYETV